MIFALEKIPCVTRLRCRSARDSAEYHEVPALAVPGVDILVASGPVACDRLLIQATYNSNEGNAEQALREEALAASGKDREAIDAEIATQIASTDEAKQLREANAAFDKATAELSKIEKRHGPAKAAYDGALADGGDPRKFRGDLEVVGRELDDVQRWKKRAEQKCEEARRAFHAAFRRAGNERWAEVASEKLREAARRRAILATRAELFVRELGMELLRVEAMMVAYS